MKRIIISAMAETNRVIGGEQGLPWHIPEEYQHFLNHIKGNVIIMGRKSWEIFSKDLAESIANIVISRSTEITDAIHADSLESALSKATSYEQDIYITGGATIYALALENNLVDEMYLSYIPGNYEGHTYFPKFDESQWSVQSEEDRGSYKLLHYVKIS